jgi:hypothetical protein
VVSREIDPVQAWILIQHYGGPTRLLDWTASPFVAAYFAVEQDPDADGEVWIVHGNSVDQAMRKKWPDYHALPDDSEEARLFTPTSDPRLYFIQPTIATERLIAQQTVVALSADVIGDHGEILATLLTANDFIRLVIPKRLKANFLLRLQQMNITARSLFPGIDGLGRSLKHLLQISRFGPPDAQPTPGVDPDDHCRQVNTTRS